MRSLACSSKQVVLVLGFLCLGLEDPQASEHSAAKTTPPNDACMAASPISLGVVQGSLEGANQDGASHCSLGEEDVWYRFTPTIDGPVGVYFTGENDNGFEISAYESCPGTSFNTVTCASGGIVLEGTAGQEVILRVAKRFPDQVDFSLRLETPGALAGTVYNRDGNPLAETEVIIFDQDGQAAGSGLSSGNGSFLAPVAKPGTYFAMATRDDHLRQLFDGISCPGDMQPCPPTTGTPVQVTAGSQVDGIDFHLDALGRISGTLTNARDGQPIPLASVRFFEAFGGIESSIVTDDAGRYSKGGLRPGDFYLGASDSAFLDELYDDIPCATPFCDLLDGDAVRVEINSDLQGFDFALEPLGQISGRTTDAVTGQPIPFLDIVVYSADSQEVAARGLSDTQGNYRSGGLTPGDYLVVVSGLLEGYFSEIYPGLPCPGTGCDLSDGTPIHIEFDSVVNGIDFALDRLGTIRGTLRESDGGAPLPFASVNLFDHQGALYNSNSSQADGSFTLSSIVAGTYFLRGESFRHATQVYGGPSCLGNPDDCDPTSGTPITVAASMQVVGLELSLDRLGVISGSIRDGATGEPLAGSFVQAWDADGQAVNRSKISLGGSYKVEGLLPGSYTLTASVGGYRSDLYPSLPCDRLSCDVTRGTPIAMDLNQVVEGIDFPLTRKASITGTMVSQAGNPVRGSVQLWDAAGQPFAVRSSDAQGRFEFFDLDAGSYFVSSLVGDLGYIDQVFGGQPCVDGVCDPRSGSSIAVVEGVTSDGIALVIARLGVISGQVRDNIWQDPRPNVMIQVQDGQGNPVASTVTDLSGAFEIFGLDAGTYYLTALDEGFLGQRYAAIPCIDNACGGSVGTPVSVGDNVIASGIDFELEMQQGITGTVRDERTGRPLVGATVESYGANGFEQGVITNGAGHYLIALRHGTHHLLLDPNFTQYQGTIEIYNDISCPFYACDPLDGEPLVVESNQVLLDVDFDITGQFCTPDAETLCLNDQRFAVTLGFTDFTDTFGLGQARPLTDDSGTFYFFAPDNLEVVVKILDGCVDPFNHFWVFATGLTNLQTSLRVIDTYTGEQRTYTNPLGMPFQLIRDTTAFATCDKALDSRLALQTSLDEILDGHFLPAATAASDTPTSLKTSGPCVPSSTVLCVQDGRFRVEAQWEAPDGAAGSGQAVPLTADTGYFWFFADDNVEVILKVLDACGDNPFNSFWVFAAGLTDVEVTLTVTDTVSGEEQVYFNPQGSAFVPVQDTAAFLTCP